MVKVNDKNRVYLLLIYFFVNIYPLYVLFEYILSIPNLFPKLILSLLTIIWVIGVFKTSPHVLVVYYVLTGIILLVAIGGVYLSAQSIVVYALIAFLGDYFGRLLISTGKRRTEVSLTGLLYSVFIFFFVISVYFLVSYITAGFALYIVDSIVSNTPILFQIFFNVFISSRIGSLVLFMFIVFIAYYILSEYITYVLMDTLLLSPSFALHRVINWVYSEAKKIILGKDDFQKLYSRSMFTLIGFYVYLLLFPLYGFIIDVIRSFIGVIFASLLWFGLSLLLYGLMRGRFTLAYKPLKPVKLSVSKIPIILSSSLLIIYLVILYIEGLPVTQLLLRSIGLSNESFIYYSFRDVVSRTYFIATTYYYYYSQIYIDKLVEAYYWLNKIIEFIIKFLWG